MKNINIDFSKIHSIKQLHKTFADMLCFPSYYGNNFSALYDMLSELSPNDITITFTNINLMTDEIKTQFTIILDILSKLNIAYSLDC